MNTEKIQGIRVHPRLSASSKIGCAAKRAALWDIEAELAASPFGVTAASTDGG
jgi:hypothetical protein